MNFIEISAQQLLKGYREHRYRIHEVTLSVIETIKKTQTKLNALVEDRFQEAIEESQKKQVALDQGQVNWEITPLWGLPVTVKEMIAVKGLRQTLGTLDRKDWISHEDATLVQRLKNLGAIILGTTNVSELGFWFESSNPVYGATNNPINPAYTSGGSSGGEGALVGSGITPLGFGSDIGGSIRIPASFCGCIGYKPSVGVLPVTGHFPATSDYWDQWTKSSHMTSLGFLSHHIEDLKWITQLLSGPDSKDPSANIPPLKWDLPTSNLKVYVLADPDFDGAYRADSEVVTAITNCGKYLEAMGFEVLPLAFDFFSDALGLWLNRAKSEKVDHFFKLLSPLKSRSVYKELFFKLVGKKQFEWPALITAALDSLSSPGGDNPRQLNTNRTRLYSLLGTNAVIVLPTHPRSGIVHGHSLTRPFDFIYTGTANLYDLPAIQIPVATSPQNNIPIGCQVWASPGHDTLALHIGQILRDAFKTSSSFTD